MITPKIKDDLLQFVVNSSPRMEYSGNLKELSSTFSLTEDELEQIFYQFDRKGFVKFEAFHGGGFVLAIRADAHDYVLAGGHVAEFDLVDLQLKKLQTELYALEKGFDQQKFDRAKGILDTVVSAWGLLLTAAK